jgi:hypothetical protein
MSRRSWEKKMVHPPVKRPDHCTNTFLPVCIWWSAFCFAPLRNYCFDIITDIHLALPGSAPPSPPPVVRPALLTRTLFEQGISNKLHNSLVIKNKSQTKQSIQQPRDTLSFSTPAAFVAASNKKAALPPAPPQSCMPLYPCQYLASQPQFLAQRRRNTFSKNMCPSLALTPKNQSSPRKKVSSTIMNLCSL